MPNDGTHDKYSSESLRMPRSSLSYTPKMLKDIIAALNGIKRTDGTINFHDEILSTGTFSFFCPILQRHIYPMHNIMPNKATTIYVFDGAETLALISYVKIIAAITSTCSVDLNAIRIPEKTVNISRSALKGLSPNTPLIDMNLKPALIPYATPNFAHFLWNILPAIENAISAPREFEIYVRCDPFELHLKPPYSDYLLPIELCKHLSGWSPHLIFMGGSSFIPDSVRRKFLRSIINEKEPVEQKIYISIRPDFAHRHLINQVDFMCNLISAFHEKYPDMEFVVDGFSLPDDFDRPVYNDRLRALYSTMVENSRLAIGDIMQALPDSAKKLHDFTGTNLSSALETISTCSYYVCHAGTQQHKIAWLFPRNGIVLGVKNNSTLNWHAEPSECSIVPSKLDPQLVADVKFDEKKWQDESWMDSLGSHWNHYLKSRKKENFDYIISDIKLAVSQIMDDYAHKVLRDAD